MRGSCIPIIALLVSTFRATQGTPTGTATTLCASASYGNCGLPPLAPGTTGDLSSGPTPALTFGGLDGYCAPSNGTCQYPTPAGTGICGASGISQLADIVCSLGTSSVGSCALETQSFTTGCKEYDSSCKVKALTVGHQNSGRTCFGFTNCTSGQCPPSVLGLFCVYNGVLSQFTVCSCGFNVSTGGPGYVSECSTTPCACGSYCNVFGTMQCPAGHYCPANSVTPLPCPAGYFCPAGSCSGQICPCGSRCPSGTAVPQMCAPPFYCPNEGQSTQTICPIGYKCDTKGMCNATACPPGTFVTCAGKQSCDLCPAGRYCSSPTVSTICPAGYYCPAGSSTPILCPAGSWCHIGSATSRTCPAGYYCPAGSSIQTACPVGYYCPSAGLSTYTANPCPSATTPGLSVCPAVTNQSRRLLAADRGLAERAEDTTAFGPAEAAIFSAFMLVGLLAAGFVIRMVGAAAPKGAAQEAPAGAAAN